MEGTVRTLPDGYKVVCRPDDKVILLPGQSRLRERMMDRHPEHRESHQQLRERHQELVTRKQASQDAHPAVPPSKRCC